MTCIATLFLAAALEAMSPGASPTIETQQELRQVISATERLPHRLRAALIAEKFHLLYPSSDTSDQDDDALRRRFEAAVEAQFYSADRAITRELRDMYSLMRTRNIQTPEDLSSLAGALLLTRDFESLAELAKDSPQLPAPDLPTMADRTRGEASKTQILRVAGNTLIKDAYPIDQGKHVIIVSNPLCGFSEAASRFIDGDVELASFFKDHALWLVPPERILHLEEVAKWNRSHHSGEMALAYRFDAWDILDQWETPIFYFFSDGRIVDEIIGWPKDSSNATQLRRAVARFRQTP